MKSERARDYYHNFSLTFAQLIASAKPAETVPQAIQCFLESKSFEDAIHVLDLLGGERDTSPLSRAPLPGVLRCTCRDKRKALAYLDGNRAIYDGGLFCSNDGDEKFKVLTKYISKIDGTDSFERVWVFGGTSRYDLTVMVRYSAQYSMGWDGRKMHEQTFPSSTSRAFCPHNGYNPAERFCDGHCSRSSMIVVSKWLKRLKDMTGNGSLVNRLQIGALRMLR